MGQAWGYGAGLGLWGRAMRQAWGYGAGLELSVRPPDPHMWGAVGQSCAYGLQTHSCGALWVSAVRAASRPTHVGRCGSELWGAASRPTAVGRYGSALCVRPPDPQIWGALWVRPGAMGLEWSYGAGLGLWGRPGAVGQEWSYGAGLGLWGRPGPMGQGYGAGLGL